MDIKDLAIFGNNKGLEKIKKQAEEKKLGSEKKFFSNMEKQEVISTPKIKKRKKGAGPPIRKFDRVYSTKKPIKLSALLDSTAKIIVEKYETNLTKDELLRKALDNYIKQNLTKEDKQDLFNNVLHELEIFRIKNPTVPELDYNQNIVRNSEEIELETRKNLQKNWGIE